MDLMTEYLEQKKQNDTLVASLTQQLEIANIQKKYLGEKFDLITKMLEMKKQIKEQDPYKFEAFCKARVRVLPEKPESVYENQALPLTLFQAYGNYIREIGAKKRLNGVEFQKKAEETFGKPERPLYQDTERFKDVYAFHSQEDVEAFDTGVLEALETQV